MADGENSNSNSNSNSNTNILADGENVRPPTCPVLPARLAMTLVGPGHSTKRVLEVGGRLLDDLMNMILRRLEV